MKPRYVIDLDRLAETARVARGNADRLGVRLLMALKSFPLPAAFPALAPYVEGLTASGLYEAKLGRLMGKDVHVHAPAYADDEMPEICATCSHVVGIDNVELNPGLDPSGRSTALACKFLREELLALRGPSAP